jgi:hypothetical protein
MKKQASRKIDIDWEVNWMLKQEKGYDIIENIENLKDKKQFVESRKTKKSSLYRGNK